MAELLLPSVKMPVILELHEMLIIRRCF